MTIPTPDEIRAAYDEITKEGPAAESTTRLGVLAMKDAVLRQFVFRVEAATMLDRAAIQGAVMYGLNLGLRIGEARLRAQPRTASILNKCRFCYLCGRTQTPELWP